MSIHCSTSRYMSLKRYFKVTLIIEHYHYFLLLANDHIDIYSIKYHFIFILIFDTTKDKTLVNISSVSITDN